MKLLLFSASGLIYLLLSTIVSQASDTRQNYNILYIISDDLTYTALSCYGNTSSRTPNIDRLASQGVRFTSAYSQGSYCGPSRASFMSGYYPDATRILGYENPRKVIGDRATWPQYFKNNGYHSVRISKVYHMNKCCCIVSGCRS